MCSDEFVFLFPFIKEETKEEAQRYENLLRNFKLLQ